MKIFLLFTLVLLVGLNGFSQLSNGLISYYPFNGNAIDESVNTFDALSVNATISTDRNGQANSAYSFNGSQFIQLPANIVNTLPLSVCLWFESNSSVNPSTIQRIVAFSDNTTGRQTMSLNYNFNGNGLVDFRSEDVSSGGVTISSSSQVSINEWHHLVVTINIVPQPGNNPPYSFEASLFVDGVLAGASPYSFTQPAMANEGFVGKFNATNAQGLVGSVDDIAFFNRILLPSEIQLLYNGENPTGTTGLEEINDRQISIYPNPAQDIINVVLSDPNALSVCDINGKTLIHSAMNVKHQINVQQLETGVYFIQTSNGITQKFIKQ